jgi:hypothetical protein
MIYLYGITGRLSEPIIAEALEGAALETLEVSSLTAVYSTHDRLELLADADSCWAHEHAVEAVMQRQAILPARFGTTFPSVDSLQAAIDRRALELRRCLAEVDGCVELAVRINPLTSSGGQSTGGRQYLLDKLSAQRLREALAESALACLREFAVDSRLTTSHSGDDTVSISYLVRTSGVERFSRAVGRLQRRWPEFALSCTGPWAPYSFVGDRTPGLERRPA